MGLYFEVLGLWGLPGIWEVFGLGFTAQGLEFRALGLAASWSSG